MSKDTISRITDRVPGEMTDWQNRPLDRVCPVVFIDAFMVKIRDGQATNRPVYSAIGVTVDGQREILGWRVGNAPTPSRPVATGHRLLRRACRSLIERS